MGHTEEVAMGHYRQILDDDYERLAAMETAVKKEVPFFAPDSGSFEPHYNASGIGGIDVSPVIADTCVVMPVKKS
jgi:hypothetical protein